MTGRRAKRAGIFWRVYRHGLVLLLVVLLAVGAAGWVLRQAAPVREPARLSAYLAERLADFAADPPRLEAELLRLREAIGANLTVYGPDGRLLASNVQPPLPPVSRSELLGPKVGSLHLVGSGFSSAARLPGGGEVLLDIPPRQGLWARGAVFILVVLVALALGSIPLARSIAAPLERLTEAARALGAGDLSVRTNLRTRGEVGELSAAFDDMAARLERLVRAEKELLANVSHELRTPLTRIRMALALAEEGDVARARQAMAEIGDDLAELERLVAETLAAARVDLASAGELPLHLERIDPAALLGEVATRFRAQWPERRLEIELAPPLPEVDADPALLRRLLGILLDNARKYSEGGDPVTLAARASEGQLALEVRDRGIGIAPEDLPRLFTPFFRTDRSRDRGTGGVGLGLALARRIAEAHGGRVAAESAPGAGTTLRVTFPAA